jgi:hypothetical protein
MQENRPRPRIYLYTLGFLALLSLWLRMAYPIMALGPAGHDDQLFVKLAGLMGQGKWLGPYDNLTHAKGIAFSVFMLLNHVTGLPLKFTEHVLYLGAALLFATTLGQIFRSRWCAVVAFALVAFSPIPLSAGVGGRVVRENFYVSMALFMLALGLRCWVLPMAAAVGGASVSLAEQLRRKWPILLLLGLVAGIFWLTREEGVWMAPSMAVLGAYWLWAHRSKLGSWKPALGFLVVPMLGAGLVVGAVNTANYVHYGVFRNNDFRSPDFQAGYGALARIRHDAWQRYVVFPHDARQRAYAMSPAAAELKPSFEGPVGEFWRGAGCGPAPTVQCPEILSGWFMWALRDAVAHAGYYRDARSARNFYKRLAREIDAACQQQPADCLPARQSLVPPWQTSYLDLTLQASADVFRTLATLGGARPSVGRSEGTPQQLAAFAFATNDTLASTADANAQQNAPFGGRDAARHNLANRLARVEATVSSIGLPLALSLWLLWCVSAAIRRKIDVPLVIATALAAAVVSRVVLLGFLEATSIPSNNMLYLGPVVPMSLLLLPTVLWGIFRTIRPLPGSIERMVPIPG